MRTLKYILVALTIGLYSCSSVYVNYDYDKQANFGNYKTYAFSKSGVDKAQISDLDKKRILNSLDSNLSSKGMTKSENADIIVSFFTKERERINIYNNSGFGWGGFGWGGWGWGGGWGWSPFWGGGFTSTSTTPEGTLFIEFYDSKTKELVWQGQGNGDLSTCAEKKDVRINEFVSKIIEQYPPKIN